MRISVVIPAKGNSDRLRDKNLVKVLDKSLTEMACEKFLKSKIINDVYLDTDSEKIIDDVLHLFSKGLKLIRRPKELANNNITANDLMIYALHSINKCDLLLQSFVTSPLLRIETIDQCIKKFLKSKKFRSFLTVESTKEYWWSKSRNPINFDVKKLPNGVDLEKIYKETHGLYGIYTKDLFKYKNRFGINPMLIETSKVEGLDINDEDDLKFLKAIMQYEKN
jgi:CMP-N-acetylneuraminic acid synthetase